VALFLLLAMTISGVFLFGTQRIVKSGWQGWAKPLVADYVDLLAAGLGSPPDADKARALVARLPISVRIEGPRVQYDSHPDRRVDDWRRADPSFKSDGWGLVRSSTDGHRISFGLASLPDTDRPRRLGWFTLAALLGLTLLAYAVVHRLLRPLGAIGEGVARFGRGDFGQPITVPRRDELGELAERINQMAASLQGMLEDKRALLLAISHELRSPLTRARLNAELVDEGPARGALLKDLAEMRDLISSLLESERIAAGAPALHIAPVDLLALLHETVADASPASPLQLALDDESLRSLAPVAADATRLRLLLRNLVDNAQRHALGATPAPQLFLRREPDDRLALGVRDHGPGVPDEQLPRLAQAFYRPDSARTRSAGGVGLGLYLCRLVAQAHGGELRIRRVEPGLEVTMVWNPRPAMAPAGPAETAAPAR
jgi:signal transduction histidine kinase